MDTKRELIVSHIIKGVKKLLIKQYGIIIFTIFVVSISAYACSVPVFRYGLEHWPQDLYQVFVFFEDSIPHTSQNKARHLSALAARVTGNASLFRNTEKEDPYVNIVVTFVDIKKDLPELSKDVWKEQKNVPLPWCVVRFPRRSQLKQDFWKGSFRDLPIKTLFESPKRTAVSELLLKGESVVWVLLETGKKGKDKKALKALQEGLDYSMSTLKLPEISKKDRTRYLSGGLPEIRLSFSIVTVNGKDPQEEFFCSMLLKSAPLLVEKHNEPIAFPIFARGRSLYGLASEHITTKHIYEANGFLAGPCACTVKTGNPGTDLLLRADFRVKQSTAAVPDEPLPPLQGFEKFLSPTNK